MAVYTPLSEREIVSHLSRYDLGGLKSFSGIGAGIENTNYLLETEKGKFILTLFEDRADPASLPFCLAFMETLEKSGLHAPRPVPDRTGERTHVLKGRHALISTFLPGQAAENPAPRHCAALGETLARMHRAGDGFPLTRQNAMALPEWRRLVSLCGERAEGVETGLAAFLRDELSFLASALPAAGALPRGAIHADVFPDNVFFEGEKISGVIDFWFSCTDCFAYDLMLALNAWCFAGGALDLEKSSALLRAYAKTRALSRDECRALPLFGRAAALRIVATRLYDLLHPKEGAIVTPKDPLQHLAILRFHQAAGAATAYGLAA